MAVIVMEGMIDGEETGVMFTKNIWEDNKETVLVEVSEEIGKDVVSEIKTPNGYMVDKKLRG